MYILWLHHEYYVLFNSTYYILVLHIILHIVHIYIYTVYVHIVIVCSYIWDIYRICIIDILRSKMDRENYKL